MDAMKRFTTNHNDDSCSRGFGAYFIFVILVSFCQSSTLRAPPLIDKSPFLSIWNVPTEQCMTHHNTSLDLQFFQLAASPVKTATNQELTLFYSDRLGYYPYINVVTGESINGGLPQFIPLARHLQKAAEDIRFYIPSEKQAGFSVIDWEEWRPLWVRNWGFKTVYKNKSIEMVLQNDHTLKESQASPIAKKDFEAAAKQVMQETILLGRFLRPSRFWGYYLFPECYNYDYKQNRHNYTGSCPDVEKKRNDELKWLWTVSTALYPSIYLETALNSTPNAALYSRNRIQEAKRVSTVYSKNTPLSIYVYTRPVFTNEPKTFLSQDDLVNTIGEVAALGASGIVLWGDVGFSESAETCKNVGNYMKNILNPYVINVTLATQMCSQILCQNRGACTRKNWNASDYLHLNPRNFNIKTDLHRKYSITGHPTMEDIQRLTEKFDCSCYSGNDCLRKGSIHNISNLNICIYDDICIMIATATHIHSVNQTVSP